MAVNLLGATTALNDAAQGVTSGYYNALGTLYQRGLAQQKQASESNLQAAQASQYATDNPTKLAVAQTLGSSRLGVADIQSGARQKIAMDVALGKLPSQFAGQSATAVRATMRTMDPTGQMEQNYFGNDPAGLPGDPNAHVPILGDSSAAPAATPITGATPSLPPSGPIGSVSSAGSASASPLSPPPLVMGGGLALPAPVGGMSSTPYLPSTGSVSAGLPAPGTPPVSNPFSVPPLMAARVGSLNASAGLNQLKAQFYPQLTQSQIDDNLGKAGLMTAQGKFYDARTKEEIPLSQAKIALDAAMGKALGTNAGANALRAQVYGQTQPVIAGADALRASAYQQGINQTGAYQQGELGLGAGRLGVAQGQLGVAQGRLQAMPGGKNGAMTPQQYQQVIDKNNAQKNQILRGLMTKQSDGSSAQRTPTQIEQNIINAADANIQAAQNQQRRLSLAPLNPVGGGYHLIPGVGSSVRGVSGPSVPPLPNFPGAGRPPVVNLRGMTLTPAQIQAELARRGHN